MVHVQDISEMPEPAPGILVDEETNESSVPQGPKPENDSETICSDTATAEGLSDAETDIPVSKQEETNQKDPSEENKVEPACVVAVRNYFVGEEFPFHERSGNEGSTIFCTHLTGKNGYYKTIVQVKPQDSNRIVSLCEAPVKVPAGRRAVAAEYLMRINFSLTMGAFEIDFTDGEVRTRNSIEMNDGILTKDMVQGLVMIPASTIDRFFAGLLQVVYGSRPPQEALEEARSPGATSRDGDDGANNGGAAALMQLLASLQ